MSCLISFLNRKPFLFLLMMFILSFPSNQKINIWEPKPLKSMYANTPFDYTLMDFGSVPYGHSIYGTVFKASPYNACKELKPLKWDNNFGTLILLVNRGGCNFSEKVINAQKIGAGFVMIADNSDENIHRIFPIERTKDRLDSVKIPSVLISKEEASDILKALASPNHKPHRDGASTVELAIHFELTKSYGKTNLKFIVSVDDYKSYDLMLNFDGYFSNFKKHLNLQIHFKLFYNSKKFFDDEDCIGPEEHHYCVSKSFGNSKTNLNLPVETLKQLCLKNTNYNHYIRYVKLVREECFNEQGEVKDDFKDCTEKNFKKIASSSEYSKIEKCIDPNSQEALDALENNHDDIKYYLINYSPLIFINGSYFKGNYDDENHLMESICNSYEEPPTQCSYLSLFDQVYNLNSHHLNKFILISLCFCLASAFLAILIFYILYKRKIKKSFNFTLNDKINEALAKFYEDDENEEKEQDSIDTDITEEINDK